MTKQPTHLAEGELTKTCTVCGATKTEAIDRITEHSFGDWTSYDNAQHSRTCECGEIEYADHEWDEGTITIPATYERDGEKTYTCLTCGATYTSVIPKPESPHEIILDDGRSIPGGTVKVNVRLEGNSGVAMMRLKVSYDSSVLTLDRITYNTDIGGATADPAFFDGYAVLLWYNESENSYGDWTFATLTFTVNPEATPNTTSEIVLTYDADEVCDIEENNVVFSVENGVVSILDHVPGDITGDKVLNSKDVLRVARYFSGWDVEVNELALDVNGDGKVNSKDLLRLARYLAGWDVEIY